MLTLYHFILTKGYAPLRRGGMRSLGDGKGGWSEASRSCSAWTEDVPSDVGALEPLPLLLLCLLWRVPSESSALEGWSQGSGGEKEAGGRQSAPSCVLTGCIVLGRSSSPICWGRGVCVGHATSTRLKCHRATAPEAQHYSPRHACSQPSALEPGEGKGADSARSLCCCTHFLNQLSVLVLLVQERYWLGSLPTASQPLFSPSSSAPEFL